MRFHVWLRHRYSQLFGRGAPEEVNRCDDSGRVLLFQNGIHLDLKEDCCNGSQGR